MGDDLVITPGEFEEESPFHRVLGKNRLIMLVDSNDDWPQPIISSAEKEKAEKKAKRRISKYNY